MHWDHDFFTAVEAEMALIPEVEKQVNITWKESQDWLSGLSTNSEYIQVPNTRHSINYDNPQIIVESVINLMKALQ